MIGSKTLRNYAAGGLGAAQVLRFFWDRIQSTSLRDKTVLVTGGSRGLGLALAREFHARGARVAICARDEKELRRAAEPLGFFTVVCDLKDPAQITRMIRSLEERWGRIDVLVNNAGIISVGPVENMTIEDFQESMEVNFWAMLRTIFASLPAMRRGCRIVNITSFGGAVSMPHLLPYSVSKFAAVGLSEGLHTELSRRGIRVLTVMPGLMRTGSPTQAFFKGRQNREFSWFALGGTLPLISTSAESAARQIVEACRGGQAAITIGAPFQLLRSLHGLMPDLTIRALGLANRLLPRPALYSSKAEKGTKLRSWVTQPPFSILMDRAARKFNEREAA